MAPTCEAVVYRFIAIVRLLSYWHLVECILPRMICLITPSRLAGLLVRLFKIKVADVNDRHRQSEESIYLMFAARRRRRTRT